MDGKTIIKLLKEHGWEHVSTQGSHHKMKKPGMPPIVVPVHGKKILNLELLRILNVLQG